jgi:hypothetical protein
MAGPIISKLLTDFFNEIGHYPTCADVNGMSVSPLNNGHRTSVLADRLWADFVEKLVG